MCTEIINTLQLDKATGLHSIIEAGFKYEFPISLHDNFKNFILRHDFVSRWYKQLEDPERKLVSRSSGYQ